MKRFILATFAGAVIAFFWGYISWEFLPWHPMDTFKNDAAVSQTISDNAPAHGLYILPRHQESGPDAEAITEGPFVYAIVRPGKLTPPWEFGRHMIISFCIQLIGAFIITLAIHRIRATRYISRASVGPAMGLFAGVVMTLPYWNWFELPDSHTLAQVLDPFIAWTLAGLVIAAIITPPRARRIFS
jgi:hypothetical protein